MTTTLDESESEADGPVLRQKDVLARCTFMATMGLWPPTRTSDPSAWLKNFLPDELDVAVALLNAFLYLNDEMTSELLVAAIRGLSSEVTKTAVGYHEKRARWIHFLYSLRITHLRPMDHEGSESKSGFTFVRKARQGMALPAEQILSAEEVLASLVNGDDLPVIVVDDFSASGDQFLDSWNHIHEVSPGRFTSFAEQATSGASIYYCPALCCNHAKNEILKLGAASPYLWPAHILSDEMSVLHPDSEVIPKYLRPEVVRVVDAATARSGTSEPPYGHCDLGLALSFAHGTPDPTLPIFYCEDTGWAPLVRRR